MSSVKSPHKRRRINRPRRDNASGRADGNPAHKVGGGRSPAAARIWTNSALAPALASGLLLWAAFPPLALSPLAWVAPVFWLLLIRRDTLPGKRPYRAIYLAGFIHWLLLVQWVRLPHWSANFGWLLLAFYLGFYVPVFVGLARVAVHRLRLPLVVAAPVVWTGLELARGYVLTGFSIALLGHAQVDVLPLIQIADLAGAYAVSFLLMLVTACFTTMLPVGGRKIAWWPLAPAAAAVVLTLVYGQYRLGQPNVAAGSEPSVNVALIQGSKDTEFDDSEPPIETFKHYLNLTNEARRQQPRPDLIVWPESMLAFPLVEFESEADITLPPGSDLSAEAFTRRILKWRADFQRLLRAVTASPVPEDEANLLVGAQVYDFTRAGLERYNSALLIESSGKLGSRYDKAHRVMFGEYVPLGKYFPWVYRLTPMPDGLTPGRAPLGFEINGVRFSPSICFENTVPHLIRRQIAQLAAEGNEPDVLVTITNDGWFWGSSLLDLHLTCGRFRAVESRKPMLIAANTGFSASIDGNGRLLAKGPRRDTGVIMARDVRPDPRESWYLKIGDVFAGSCLIFCLISAVVGVWARFGAKSDRHMPGQNDPAE